MAIAQRSDVDAFRLQGDRLSGDHHEEEDTGARRHEAADLGQGGRVVDHYQGLSARREIPTEADALVSPAAGQIGLSGD
ncbi:hypothetical protein [Streptomyces tendae]